MFQYNSLSDFVNNFTSFKSTDKYAYRSSSPADWFFWESFNKLGYLFSGAIEQHLIEKWLELKEAKLIKSPKFYEECAYDAMFSYNTDGFLLEFKCLHNTSKSDMYGYLPLGKYVEESLPFPTVMLHTDKYNKLVNEFNRINTLQKSRDQKELRGIVYLCYLVKENRFISKVIYSKTNDLSGQLIGSAEQASNSNYNNGTRSKQSYYLNINEFKTVYYTNRLCTEDIIEANKLEWLYNAPEILGHLIKANKLNVPMMTQPITLATLSEKECELIYNKYKK